MELLCKAASLNYKLFAALETQSNTEIQHFLETFFLLEKVMRGFCVCQTNVSDNTTEYERQGVRKREEIHPSRIMKI